MSSADDAHSGYTRCRFLSTFSIASGGISIAFASRNSTGDKPPKLTTYNGGTGRHVRLLIAIGSLTGSFSTLSQEVAIGVAKHNQ